MEKEKKVKRIFLDSEFNGLKQDTQLISFGAVSDDGATFYFESSEIDLSKVDNWVKENVVPHLQYKGQEAESYKGKDITGCKPIKHIAMRFVQWASLWRDYDRIELWADVKEYDVVLFNTMMDSLHDEPGWKKPTNIHYIVHDLATLLWARGYDADVKRTEFCEPYRTDAPSDGSTAIPEHNALYDAKTTRFCFERIRLDEEAETIMIKRSKETKETAQPDANPEPATTPEEPITIDLKPVEEENTAIDSQIQAEAGVLKEAFQQAINNAENIGVQLIDFERKKLRMAGGLLDMASDEFSNHGNNDTPENLFEEFTDDEKVQLTKEFYDDNGNPDEFPEKFIDVGDSSWMRFLSNDLEKLSNR